MLENVSRLELLTSLLRLKRLTSLLRLERSDQCAKGETSVTLSQPEAATGDSSGTVHDKPISLSGWQAQHGIPPEYVDDKKVDDIDVDVDMPTVDAHYCYGDGDSGNDETEVCTE